MKAVGKLLIGLIILLLVLFGLFLLYITLTDFKPKEIEVISRETATTLSLDTFNFAVWNIGYAGLGAEMDFFYDDGKKVRPTKGQSRKYLDGDNSLQKLPQVQLRLVATQFDTSYAYRGSHGANGS